MGLATTTPQLELSSGTQALAMLSVTFKSSASHTAPTDASKRSETISKTPQKHDSSFSDLGILSLQDG